MGGELIVAMYTVFLSDEWDTRLPNTLKRRVSMYNYSVPQQFEHDLDIVHKQVRIYFSSTWANPSFSRGSFQFFATLFRKRFSSKIILKFYLVYLLWY